MQGKEEESTHLGVMLEVVVGEDPDVTLDLGVRLRRLGDGREGDEQKDTEIHGACFATTKLVFYLISLVKVAFVRRRACR